MIQIKSVAQPDLGHQVLVIWRQHRLAVRLVGMSILLLVALTRANLGNYARDLRNADLRLLVASVVLAYAAWLVNSFKWKRLLHASGIDCGLGELFRLNLVAIFYGLALPGQVSGEVVKALRIGSRVERRSAAYASVWLDRLTGVIGLVTVGILGLAGGPRPTMPGMGGWVVAFALGGVLILSLGLILIPRLGWLVHLLARPATGSTWLASRLRQFLRIVLMADFDPKPERLALAIALACVFQILSAGAMWTAGLSLGLLVSPLVLGWITAIIAILQILPVTVGGVGLRDLTLVSLLATYGVAGHQALALSSVVLGQLALMGLSGWLLDVRATPPGHAT